MIKNLIIILKKNLIKKIYGLKKEKIHQYLFLSKYTYYYKEHVDIGVLGIHKK